MNATRTLTPTEINAAVTEQLLNAGYRRVDIQHSDWNFANARLFEDKFGIVGLVVYETWDDLVSEWVQAQGALVALMSRYMARSDPKAWEGYLVLFTPGVRGQAGQAEWMSIRYNTRRVRKFVASGEDIKSIGDIKSVIAPLLPLDAQEVELDSDTSVLEQIPQLLSKERKLPRMVMERLVAAFEGQSNMMQALHEAREERL